MQDSLNILPIVSLRRELSIVIVESILYIIQLEPIRATWINHPVVIAQTERLIDIGNQSWQITICLRSTVIWLDGTYVLSAHNTSTRVWHLEHRPCREAGKKDKSLAAEVSSKDQRQDPLQILGRDEVSMAVETPKGETLSSHRVQTALLWLKSSMGITESNVSCECVLRCHSRCSPPWKIAFLTIKLDPLLSLQINIDGDRCTHRGPVRETVPLEQIRAMSFRRGEYGLG